MTESSDASNMPFRLFVKNVSNEVSKQTLFDIFSRFGRVMEIKIPVTKRGIRRDYVFITFRRQKDAYKAMNDLHGMKLLGKHLVVQFGRQQPQDENEKKRTRSPSNSSECLDSTTDQSKRTHSTATASMDLKKADQSEACAKVSRQL